MKTMRLAALVVALATPAWAFNGPAELSQATQDEWDAAYNLCVRVGGNPRVCWIRHAPSEILAAGAAKANLVFCETEQWGNKEADCAAVRDYIKQRWGY